MEGFVPQRQSEFVAIQHEPIRTDTSPHGLIAPKACLERRRIPEATDLDAISLSLELSSLSVSDPVEPFLKNSNHIHNSTEESRDIPGNNSRDLCSPRPVIDNLPYELLFYTFELAVLMDFSSKREVNGFNNTLELLPYPFVLSRVCSSWHQIVYASASLWSYIHLVVSEEYRDQSYAYATRVIEHASDLPLSVHVHHPVRPGRRTAKSLAFRLAPIANRVYALKFSGKNIICDLVHPTLCTLLKYITPSKVRELNVSYPEGDRRKCFELASFFNYQPWRIIVFSSQTEFYFESMPTLKLNGIFIQWDSQVYPRVTHLDLRNGSIAESQLIGLLSNTPRLSHLTFNLNIKRARRNTPSTTIPLPKLEVLNLMGMKTSHIWSILRLIAPDSIPLTLILEIGRFNYSEDFTQTPEAKAFFRRSHVSACYLKVKDDFEEPWFLQVLHQLPGLRTLYLQDCSYLALLSPDLCLRLRVLCMNRCKLDLDEFQELLKTRSIQALRLWDCIVFAQNRKTRMTTQELECCLSEFVSDVRCYQGTEVSDMYLDKWDYVGC